MYRGTMDYQYIDIIQDEFRKVATEGTGSHHWADDEHNVAIKTGTAQNHFFEDGILRRTNNLALVGYAPYDEPEIAFAIIVPRTALCTTQQSLTHRISNRTVNSSSGGKHD